MAAKKLSSVGSSDKAMNRQSGLSLIEILITIGLVGLVGAALIRLGTTALTASDAGRQRAVATQLADEALEAARAWRDNNSSEFFDAASQSGLHQLDPSDGKFKPTNCNPDEANLNLQAGAQGCALNVSGTTFYRMINFAYPDALRARITVYVFWSQQGTWTKVISSTVLTQWR